MNQKDIKWTLKSKLFKLRKELLNLVSHTLPFVLVCHPFHLFLLDEDEVYYHQEMDCTVLVPKCKAYHYSCVSYSLWIIGQVEYWRMVRSVVKLINATPGSGMTLIDHR